VRATTLPARRRLYEQARAIVAERHTQALTLPEVAQALACSPRALQRAYAQCASESFSEELRTRRMSAAAELLATQPAIAVADVARRVGLGHAPHFADAFRRRYGLAPAEFRRAGRSAAARSARGAAGQ
jgi:AraC-like DNA-binding protein